MKVIAIKTPIFQPKADLFAFLKENIRDLKEESMVVVTSKIISYAQDRFVEVKTGTREEKHELVKQETDSYIDPSLSKYDIMLTIKDSVLAVNAGIDESNSVDKYVLWPENLQQVTNEIWQFLRKEFKLEKLGVIVTDSKTIPLRWGITGTAAASCGFKPLIDKRGENDIFGRELVMTQIQVAEAIAVAAVFEMGEGSEQQPLAVVTEIEQPIVWQNRPPTDQELKDLVIKPEDDVYAPILLNAKWSKGGKK